jgi:hypothetical protein
MEPESFPVRASRGGRQAGGDRRSQPGRVVQRLASRGRRSQEDRTGHPFVRLAPSVGKAPSAASRDSRASAVFILARPRTTRILLRLTPGPVRSRGVSSVGRALQWHCRGQGFDSPTLQCAPGPKRGVALGHSPQQPDEARRRRRRSAAGRGQDLAGRPDVENGRTWRAAGRAEQPDVQSSRTCRAAGRAEQPDVQSSRTCRTAGRAERPNRAQRQERRDSEGRSRRPSRAIRVDRHGPPSKRATAPTRCCSDLLSRRPPRTSASAADPILPSFEPTCTERRMTHRITGSGPRSGTHPASERWPSPPSVIACETTRRRGLKRRGEANRRGESARHVGEARRLRARRTTPLLRAVLRPS